MKIRKNMAISDSGLVFNPVSGESFSVNPIGIEIINYLREGKSFEMIRKHILDRYNTDETTFEKDFHDFIGILGNYNMLDENEEKKA